MASLKELIADGSVCQCLRSKKLFYQTDDPRAVPQVPSTIEASDGPYWCGNTQAIAGPDGEIADTETCRPGRSCCETS